MKILKVSLIAFLSIILLVGLFLGTLTVFEYRPKQIEELSIVNNQDAFVFLDTDMTIMTFNMGYAGLGENEDFIMDGGTQGIPKNKEVVETYFNGIKQVLSSHPVDFYLMQEVDVKARRSYRIDQLTGIENHLGSEYSTQFAYNFKALLVPFPVSLTDYIGFVQSGIATFTTYRVESSTRFQFPGAFSWPLRVANLKRTMMVSTFEISGSTKKLHIVNLHMSAYDASGTLREQEMAFLKAYLEEQNELGNYVIVGGDFNQTFPSAKDVYQTKEGLWEAYPIEDDFLPTGYRFAVDLSHPTCRLLNQPYDPTHDLTQFYIIDGFIVSANVDIISYDGINEGAMTLNLDFQYSDHNPVVMKFRLI